jgi:FixJ family two-component response regulator
MRRAIERLLHAAGYATQAFASAEAVLETGAGNRAACLVLDVHLPGLSGFDLRARLEAAGAKPPVVFITAHDESQWRDAAGRAGAIAYLLKPFAGHELLDAVARAVAGYTEME